MKKLAPSARAMVLSLQYFTRLSLPGRLLDWAGFDESLQRASLAHFPGAGWVVGGAGGACYAAIVLLLPSSGFAHLAAAVASTVATVLLTGALHEDGLADTADGLAAGKEPRRVLEVMKDSRLGPSGALALAVALLARIFLLSCIGVVAGLAGALAALLGGHVVSRGLSLGVVATLPHLGHAATSKSLPVARQVGRDSLSIAAIWCIGALVLVAWVASPAAGVVALASAVIALSWMRFMLARRLAGFTGDCLGATQQLCEIAFYLGIAVAI